MALSKCLRPVLAGSLCAFALALATDPAAAQSRFGGQNDVPGSVIVEPDEQKINPDTIPEFPATGDTSVRPRFYMSPGSRCTELEDPLPGGCEANTLQRDSRSFEPIDGRILPFPLALPPLPPVALAPLPKLAINVHLPLFVAHPILPPALALPIIVPAAAVPSVHIVFPPAPTQSVALAHITIPQTDPIKVAPHHPRVRPHDRVSVAKPGTPFFVYRDFGAGVPKQSHMSVQPLRLSLPSVAFIKPASGVFPSAGSVPSVNARLHHYSVDLTKHGIAHPMHAPTALDTTLGRSHGYASPVFGGVRQAHAPVVAFTTFHDPVRTPLIATQSPITSSGVVPDTVVKSLVTRSTIVIGSSPHAHSTTLTHPTAYVLH